MPAVVDSSDQQTQDAGSSRTLPLMTRDEIEALIASGRHIIIHRGYVLRLDAWLKYHPGGAKSIMHMVGRDATDWVEVYVAYAVGMMHILKNDLLMPSLFFLLLVYTRRRQSRK